MALEGEKKQLCICTEVVMDSANLHSPRSAANCRSADDLGGATQ